MEPDFSEAGTQADKAHTVPLRKRKLCCSLDWQLPLTRDSALPAPNRQSGQSPHRSPHTSQYALNVQKVQLLLLGLALSLRHRVSCPAAEAAARGQVIPLARPPQQLVDGQQQPSGALQL